MSNRKIDTLLKEFDGNYKSIRVFDKTTYVVIEIKGFTGVGYAICGNRDEFSLEEGIKTATRRAAKHIAKQMDELGVKYMEQEREKPANSSFEWESVFPFSLNKLTDLHITGI